MEKALIGLAGVIVGALLNELLSLIRERNKKAVERMRITNVLSELLKYIQEIQTTHSEKTAAWTYGHTSRIPKMLFEEVEKLRNSDLLSPIITVELMFIQQALINLDENLRCFYEDKLNGGGREKQEAELVTSSAASLGRMLERIDNSIGKKAYRDRDTPHKAPLPHHAAYGSVLRDSADQAESDPGERKPK